MLAIGSIFAYQAPKDGTPGLDGDPGLTGQTVMQVKWVPGSTYYNDQTGNFRRIDILILYDSSGAVTGRYQCNATYTSSTEELPPSGTGNSHWTRINALDTLYTPLFIADNGEITFLSSNQILIKKTDGTVTAGISGAGSEDTGIRFWAGAQNPVNAPFKVNELGEITSEKGFIKGGLISSYANIDEDNSFDYINWNLDTGEFNFIIGRDNIFCFIIEHLLSIGDYPIVLPKNVLYNGYEVKMTLATWKGGRNVYVKNVLVPNYSTNSLSRSNITLSEFKEYRFKCIVFEPYSGYPLSLTNGKAVEWIQI